jgi:hypothetical protein
MIENTDHYSPPQVPEVPEDQDTVDDLRTPENVEVQKHSPEQVMMWWGKFLEKYFTAEAQQGTRVFSEQKLREYIWFAEVQAGVKPHVINLRNERAGRAVPKEELKEKSSDSEGSIEDIMAQSFDNDSELKEYVEAHTDVQYNEETERVLDGFFFHDVKNTLNYMAQPARDLVGLYERREDLEESFEDYLDVQTLSYMPWSQMINQDLDAVSSYLTETVLLVKGFDLETGEISRFPAKLDGALSKLVESLSKFGDEIPEKYEGKAKRVKAEFSRSREERETWKTLFSRMNVASAVRLGYNLATNSQKAYMSLAGERERLVEKYADVAAEDLPEEEEIEGKQFSLDRILSPEILDQMKVTSITLDDSIEIYIDDYALGFPINGKTEDIPASTFSRELEGYSYQKFTPIKGDSQWIAGVDETLVEGTAEGTDALIAAFKNLDAELIMVNRIRDGRVEGATTVIKLQTGPKENYPELQLENPQ